MRDFRSKLVSERDHREQMSISPSASQGEKTKVLKIPGLGTAEE